MSTLCAVLCGFLLDLLLADPAWMPHPVVGMGKAISALERLLRRALPQTDRGEFWGGVILAVLLPLGTLAVSGGVCALAYWLHPAAGFLVQTLWCWQALALRGLSKESGKVYAQLKADDLPAARLAVGRIVGRDTDALTREGVTKAAVETVAENFSDGVAAPLFYMLLGGAPLALVYKSINTMDSMVGYKNDRYLYFGRAAAKLDDGVNFIPSRLAALCWIAAAFLTGHSGRGAWRIWRRDRRNHASPNSAQTESACAGALGVQLAGPAFYFGQRYEKLTIGDPLRPIQPEDILRANRMLYAAALLALLVGGGLRALLCIGWLR
jgi:adenosylcobinamide-phosphate synthase